MDKKQVLELVVQSLEAELEQQTTARDGARTAAIEAPGAMQSWSDRTKQSEGNRADKLTDRIDTLGRFIGILKGYSTERKYDTIDTGAYVKVEDMKSHERSGMYFLPVAVGVTVDADEMKVIVVTPNAPIATAMKGKKEGFEYTMPRGNKVKVYRVE